MASTTQQKTASAVKHEVAEQVLFMPVSEIEFDYKWNCRSGDFTKVKGGPDGKGWNEFMTDIGLNGQDQPCIVRQPAKAGGKVRLVSGFRRGEAVRHLQTLYNASTDTDKLVKPMLSREGPHHKGLLKVIVRELDDAQARALNLRENTDREDLKGADIAFAAFDLSTRYKWPQAQIATELGFSLDYMSKMIKIMTNLDPQVANAWRELNSEVTYRQMEKLATDCPKDRQMAEFTKLIKGEDGGEVAARGKDAWQNTVLKKSEELGFILGRLSRSGLVAPSKSVSPSEFILSAVKINKKYNTYKDHQKDKLMVVWSEAFNKGTAAGMKDEDDKDDDKDE